MSIKRITVGAIAAGAAAVAIAAGPAAAQITLEPAASDQAAQSAQSVGSPIPGTGSFQGIPTGSFGLLCTPLPSGLYVC
ncbi:hypothetical protein [Nocardia transvalensis]|uniref:hypothetical protein n=1 Tax=Nocardia transvalensis TaxID=37333 RepID=UPI00189377D4|nr:hypothetical protein [Nocardia transvalensis]MBF6332718.1 hypothetical protein [Nocardia transvalensis]